MTAIPKRSITLSKELDALAVEAVKDGRFSSVSEVLREALRDWGVKEEMRRHGMEMLKKAYNEGIASGTGRHISGAKLLAEFKGKARKRG